MTIESPKSILANAYSSALSYSAEVVEDSEYYKELVDMTTEFLQRTSRLKEIMDMENKSKAMELLKEFMEEKYVHI